ncbi:MAG: hypothetical protein PHQ65_17745 [Bacteroidales bacterium]|nr:hypothetical protein [Bacteroidales bacterium]
MVISAKADSISNVFTEDQTTISEIIAAEWILADFTKVSVRSIF